MVLTIMWEKSHHLPNTIMLITGILFIRHVETGSSGGHGVLPGEAHCMKKAREGALRDTRFAAPHGQVHMHRSSSLISNPAVESWMEKS